MSSQGQNSDLILNAVHTIAEKPICESYRYEQLPNAQSFRLLKISKDKSLTLKTFSLTDGCPSYIALSYTWGPPLDTDESVSAYETAPNSNIILNTPQGPRHHQIAKNLYEGLQQLLESMPDTYFWIDAISVNQEDIDERSAQVCLMGDIYSRCKATLVWLGQDTSDLVDFVNMHDILVPRFKQYLEINGMNSLGRREWNIAAMQKNLNLDTGTYLNWPAYARFYKNRRWFHRAWIIQEVVLPAEIIVFCEKTTLSWLDMFLLAQCLRITGLGDISLFGLQTIRMADESPLLIMPGRQMVMLHTLRHRCKNIGSAEWPDEYTRSTGIQNPEKLSLHFFEYFLTEMRSAKA